MKFDIKYKSGSTESVESDTFDFEQGMVVFSDLDRGEDGAGSVYFHKYAFPQEFVQSIRISK